MMRRGTRLYQADSGAFLISRSVDQVGTYESKVALECTGRLMVLAETFDSDQLEDDVATRGRLLLSQLDLILVSDPLIDELGFVHPSQLTSLHSTEVSTTSDVPFSKVESNNSLGSATFSSTGGEESHARSDCSRETEHEVDQFVEEGTFPNEEGTDDELPYDTTAFWCGDHKLAISMLALAPMYKCAKATFMSIRLRYKKLLQSEEGSRLAELGGTVCASGSINETVEDSQSGKVTIPTDKVRLEDSLLSYSRALVLINCDYATAWSTRKQIIQNRAVKQEFLIGELHMASVVLSCGPKSEETWAYRRWVINQMIAGGVSRGELDSLLEGESKLVEAVAERSLMNYRAWHHRCWIVSQMSFSQVATELHRTKVWAASHVADNCCFHYRRALLLQLMKSDVPERKQISLGTISAKMKELDMKSSRIGLLDGPETRVLWKEEMDWIKKLIQQYIGREALWIHLRFLFLSWVDHVGPMFSCPYGPSLSAICTSVPWDAEKAFLTIDSEQNFADCCLLACSSVLTEEGGRQREFAATYKLWVFMVGSRKQKEIGKNRSQTPDQDDFSILEQLLQDVVPHRKQLWEGLLPNCKYTYRDPLPCS